MSSVTGAGKVGWAVVLYVGSGAEVTSLPEVIGRIVATATAESRRPVVYVVHAGLSPVLVNEIVLQHGDVRFLAVDVVHYDLFPVEPWQLARQHALDALRVEGFHHVVVAPAARPAVELVSQALGWRWNSADTPGPTWTTALDRSANGVFLFGGALAGQPTLRRVDRLLSDGTVASSTHAPWSVLAAVRTALIREQAIPDDSSTVLLASPIDITSDTAGSAAPTTVEEPTEHPRQQISEDLISAARLAMADADYALARSTLVNLIERGDVLTDAVLLLYARVLRSCSEYTAAQQVLQQVANRVEAAAEAAEIAWVTHDLDAVSRALAEVAQADPGNRRAALIRERCATSPVDVRASDGRQIVSHVAFYVGRGGNFGDSALPAAVRGAVTKTAEQPLSWLPIHVHQLFDDERRELVNCTSGIVVGGGGLFLPDTAANGNSGWQWNVTNRQLQKLTVPLAVVGVGFNLFPGQTFVGDLFSESVRQLVETATVVGLRNNGSVEQVRRLLPDTLADKVQYLPCPTTVLSHLHPLDAVRDRSGVVLINAAYDRFARRFGRAYPAFLRAIADYVTVLRKSGVEVRCVAHLPSDERLSHDLATTHGIKVPVDALHDLSLDQGYAVYRRADLVVGMRGHATMIPFGLGTPVLSLISHPKMRYFLEDIDRADWGFGVASSKLAAELAERTCHVLSHDEEYRRDIASIQRALLEAIRQPLNGFIAQRVNAE